MGVSTHPGFHTAVNEETTYAYAQQKVVPAEARDLFSLGEDPAEALLDDYPVVVTLDMSGLQQHVDYDAVHFVQPRLWDLAKIIVAQAAIDGAEILDTLDEYVEYGEETKDVSDDVVHYLYEYGSSVVENPAGSLLEFAMEQTDPNEFLTRLAERKLSDEALADITGQYRYLDDVPTSRILAVHYLKPWWPAILDCELEESDAELASRLDEAGWNVLSMDIVLSDDLYVDSEVVYRVSPRPCCVRVEYHGTSYQNLRDAAPELDLPVPPAPFVEERAG